MWPSSRSARATARASLPSPCGEAHADFTLPLSDENLEILVLKVVGSIGRIRRKVRRIGIAGKNCWRRSAASYSRPRSRAPFATAWGAAD